MRLITWNVNGLRTFMNYDPFFSCKGAYDKAFQELGADIICMQELKTPRTSLTKAQAVPLGYDAFLSFPASGKGYSGVGTYTSHSTVVPQKAEEGLTGLGLDPPHATLRPPLREHERIGAYPLLSEVDLFDSATSQGGAFDFVSLDLEGRAVLVDLGLFVLINVYCPNETNDDRLPYKVNFLRVLEARVQQLRKEKREVVVVGDINVVHRPEDHGEGTLASKQETFWNHPARKWFDSLIAPKGIMHDIVREQHPTREKMFTCWETRTDARASNYGTRLDYILMTSGLLPWVKHADIMADVRGSDHCPVYVDFHDSLPGPTPSSPFSASSSSNSPSGGVSLKDLLNLTQDPSRRKQATAPEEGGRRTASLPPRVCAANYEGFSEKSIKSYFAAGGSAVAGTLSTGKGKERQISVTTQTPPPPSLPSPKSTRADELIDLTSSPDTSPAKPVTTRPLAKPKPPPPKKTKESTPPKSGQLKLSSFFKQPAPQPAPSTTSKEKPSKRSASSTTAPSVSAPPPAKRSRDSSDAGSSSPLKQSSIWSAEDEAADYAFAQALAAGETDDVDEAVPTGRSESFGAGDGKNGGRNGKVPAPDPQATKEVWGALLKRPPVPKCSVHGVACLERTVTKPGPNKGKVFFICSLPLGPGHDSGGQKTGRLRNEVDLRYKCDFFCWASAVRLQAQDAKFAAGLD